MKQYEIEVREKYAHGCYGKPLYFSMVLCADSCKSAETFAEDVLYEMTYKEFFEMCIRDCYRNEHVQNSFMNVMEKITLDDGGVRFKYHQRTLADKLQNDHEFTVKARVFRG